MRLPSVSSRTYNRSPNADTINLIVKEIILLNKKEGETPLAALERFRAGHKKYKNVKMTYAGRLDPLVSGILLVLAGEARHEKEKYLKLHKEYDFTVLFGFATDTYDILGKVVFSSVLTNVGILEFKKKIKKNLKFFRGRFMQTYPMYSSRTVDGIPLFVHARASRVIKSPRKQVAVQSLKFIGLRTISEKSLLSCLERKITKVRGDFRQKEILQIWNKELKNTKSSTRFYIADFHIKSSSGTYIRSIANDLGAQMGLPTLALYIRRTKIGKWSV